MKLRENGRDSRVAWLLNHTTLREFEVPLLRSLGFEVYTPKLMPAHEAFRSGSVSYADDESCSLPQESLKHLNQHNFYEDEWTPEIAEALNSNFGTVICGLYGNTLQEVASNFRGRILLRAVGLEKPLRYSDAIGVGKSDLWRRLRDLEDRFWLAAAYETITDTEEPWLRRRSITLPLGLPERVTSQRGTWTGGDSRVLFFCPDIATAPQYYGLIYRDFRKHFGHFPYLIVGRQAKFVNDPFVAGFVPEKTLDDYFRTLAVMYYHSREPSHIHYHPLEAILRGMPVIYMRAGLLDHFGGPDQPGACETPREARAKVARVLRGDADFVRTIQKSQERILLAFSKEHAYPQWQELFVDGVMQTKVEPLRTAYKSAHFRSSFLQRFVARSLAVLLATGLLAGLVELPHYRDVAWNHGITMQSKEGQVFFLMLWGKSIVLCAPLLASSQALWCIGFRRFSEVIWSLGLIILLFWSLADVKTHRSTGNHASFYFQYLVHPSTWEQAGDTRGVFCYILRRILQLAATVTIAQAGLNVVVGHIFRLSSRRLRILAAMVLSGTLISIAFGAVPAHRRVPGSLAMEVLHQHLFFNPYDFALVQDVNSSLYRFRSGINENLGSSYTSLLQQLNEKPEAILPDLEPTRPRPHVVLLVLESLRPQVWDANFMPHTKSWASSGLVLRRHYACTNQSHLGIFTLLFSRFSLMYENFLKTKSLPPVCAAFHSAGYQCSFLTGNTIHWGRMNEFLCEPAFDTVVSFPPSGCPQWIENDRVVIRQAKQMLQRPTPQFIVIFLVSTHFPYIYPPECQRHNPADRYQDLTDAFWSGRFSIRPGMVNRYANAASFLDDEIDEFLRGLDPKSHVIALTGDHGESMGEDGAWVHASRLSDSQTRVPIAFVGAGVPHREITEITTHADVMPTLLHAAFGVRVPIRWSTGRDLLAEPPPGQAFMCNGSEGDWLAVLVRGNERLGMTLRRQSHPNIVGLYSEKGLPKLDSIHDRTAARSWADALKLEWSRLAR